MEQTIRERTEALERQTLSPRACMSAGSRGRPVDIPPCPMRTCFQRDVLSSPLSCSRSYQPVPLAAEILENSPPFTIVSLSAYMVSP